MEFKKGQVKVLANTNTGREFYVDLKDVVLNPGDKTEVTLGNKLNTMNNEIETLKKENAKNKKAINELLLIVSKLNLK